MYMFCPCFLAFLCGFCDDYVVVDQVLDKIGDPTHSIFYTAWNISKHLMRAHDVVKIANFVSIRPTI